MMKMSIPKRLDYALYVSLHWRPPTVSVCTSSNRKLFSITLLSSESSNLLSVLLEVVYSFTYPSCSLNRLLNYCHSQSSDSALES